MLTLVTSNPVKYAPFAAELERMRVILEPPAELLPEIQSLNFTETLTAKARAAAQLFNRPVIVDDTGLVLDAYAPFPGPLTATVIRSLGIPGLQRLLSGTTDRATMECHLGCWINGQLKHWPGSVNGRIDLSQPVRNARMPLSDIFVPDPSEFKRAGDSSAQLLHRMVALASMQDGIFDLHLESATPQREHKTERATPSDYNCPFCAEFENDSQNVYASLMGDKLPSRIVYEDEHFIVMPPLGEFMEGGLLVLTREHILSLAHLTPPQFDHLERLLLAIKRAIVKNWNVAPLVFEHGPAPEFGKGVCCVDHAHLNIFPASVHVEPHLADRMSSPITSLLELAKLRRAEFGYLFVQENDGARRAFDGKDVPTQLVRRIVTTQLGLTDRWHWRDYLGRDEMLATYNTLKGQSRL